MHACVQVWCIVTMVIGGFFLSFCFGRMASIISRLDADKVGVRHGQDKA